MLRVLRVLLLSRLRGGDYEIAAESRDGAPLQHPDWPGLTIDVTAFCLPPPLGRQRLERWQMRFAGG